MFLNTLYTPNLMGGVELIEDAHTGFLFDPAHPEDLTAKLRRLIDEPALISGMRAACWRRAESFLPEHVVEQYLEAYASAMRNAPVQERPY